MWPLVKVLGDATEEYDFGGIFRCTQFFWFVHTFHKIFKTIAVYYCKVTFPLKICTSAIKAIISIYIELSKRMVLLLTSSHRYWVVGTFQFPVILYFWYRWLDSRYPQSRGRWCFPQKSGLEFRLLDMLELQRGPWQKSCFLTSEHMIWTLIKHLNISIILYIAFAISSPIKRPEIKCSAKVFDLAAHLGRLLCLDVVDGGEGGPAGGVQGQAGGHLPDLLLLLDARSGQQSTWCWSQTQSQPGGQLHLCPPTVQGDLHCYLQVLDQILFPPQQILEGGHFFMLQLQSSLFLLLSLLWVNILCIIKRGTDEEKK